jgi:metal-responsive CopG/Arc/MetJ family transcriptional regulator
MKTAVSIPDEVFDEAERLAKRLKKSRSEVYSGALAEYIARHGSDRATELMDQALDEIGGQRNDFVKRASQLLLEKSDW